MSITKNNLSHNVVGGASSQRPSLIAVDELIPDPDNIKLNPPEEHQEEYERLKNEIQEEHLKNQKLGYDYGNYESIVVCPHTKRIRSGHYRTRAHKELGIPKIKFEWAIKPYDENASPVQKFEDLEDYNSSAKRDETRCTTAVRKYKLFANAYFETYGEYLSPRNHKFKEFCDKRHIQYSHMTSYLKIDEHDIKYNTDYLKQIANKKLSLTKAKQEIKKPKPKGKYDPNRRNFYKDLKDNPDILKFAMNQTKKHMKYIFDFEYDGIKVVQDKNIGTETNHITGMLSNIFNSAIVHAFRKSNVDDLKGAVVPQGRQNYFDVQFPDISKLGYLMERIEVKAGAFGKSINQTKVYGGAGGFE